MKASIIIPTFNGEHKILKVLKAIEAQRNKEFEVIVIIDGSTDNTKVLLENTTFDFKRFIVIEQKNGGRAVSRNAGARVANGEILIFFDDDMRPVEQCVELHLNYHAERPSSIMVGSQIEDFRWVKSDIQVFKGHLSRLWQAPLKRNRGNITKENLFLTAANFSIPKKLFTALSGFDERLTDAEDFDLAVRAYKADIPIYFNPDAIGWHDDFITCKSYIKRQIEYRKAHNFLKQLKPDLYKDFDNHQFEPDGIFKQAFFYFFSFKIWEYSINHFNWLLIFPACIRYRLYNYIITARSQYFPAE